MKNLLYFIVGLVCLPIKTVIIAVTYIRDLGEAFISNYKFRKRMSKNLKKD